MTPTSKLRFVERHIQVGAETTAPITTRVRILQQWWAPHWIEGDLGVPKGEWRDVPLEKEL